MFDDDNDDQLIQKEEEPRNLLQAQPWILEAMEEEEKLGLNNYGIFSSQNHDSIQ